jgi:hypothetical protein
MVKLVVMGVWSHESERGGSNLRYPSSEFRDLEEPRTRHIGKPGVTKCGMHFGPSLWSCPWSQGVESVSLALGCIGEHREGPVDLKREVPARNQKSHFGPEPEDPDREVAQPSGGIGGLHQ